MASLASVPLEGYEMQVDRTQAAGSSEDHIAPDAHAAVDEQAARGTVGSEHESGDEDDDEEILLPPPEQCLFCPSTFIAVDENLDHMKSSHGFQIPDSETLQTDLETFIAYLALVIHRYTSCLYCSHAKGSAEAVQAHMLAKGHCMLDLSPGSEFLEFWDASQEDGLDEAGH